MSLLAPAALGLLALAIPLVVLYMLKSRRRRMEVPSIRIWTGEEQFVSASLPWQRLKITAALVLQLLALAAFALLLARPFFREATLLGPHTVLVIDTSGSMATAGRFEAALERARSLVADASDAQLISIVEAGPRPVVRAAFARDPAQLANVVDSMAVGGGTEDLTGAIRLARGLATPDRATSILLLTDGGIEGAVQEPISGAQHVAFDRRGDDVAITGFGTGVPGEGAARVFVEVSNLGQTPATVRVEVAVDGISARFFDLELDAATSERSIVPVDAGPGQTVTVHLVDRTDANPLNDFSALVLTGGSELAVTVLGEGSVFLDALLRATPGISPAVGAPPDVVIVDGASAAEIDRPSWLIAPTAPPPGARIIGLVENPVVTFQRPSEPILASLDLSELAIAEAQIVEGADWLPLVSAGDVPLILLGEVGGHRVAYFTFDITHSNLPVQVGFPILGARVLDWLGGGRAAAATTAVAGTPIALAPPPGTTTRLVRPDGTTVDLASSTLEFTDTGRPGIYRVEYVDDAGAVVAGVATARQFAAGEASVEPRVLATTAGLGGGAADEEGTLLREWAPLILAIVLVLVLLEWWIAFGRPRPWVDRRSRSVREVAA